MNAATMAAAQAHARRLLEEEENLTTYGSQDLAEDWEFKILRSTTGAFKDPAEFRRILAEEARAGWVLVEKFDDQRVRLKRRGGRSAPSASFGVDPYRIYVGPTPEEQGRKVAVAVLLSMGAVAALLLIMVAIFA